MTKNQTPSRGEPRWKFIQRTAAVLEQMLAPRAQVQHDQMIPELVSGVIRQCDVVVRYGNPPRQTLAAIVEVQNRGDKVGLETFEGWCAKREKVGAQRLICVSCEDFTEGVVKSAESMGDVVSLMTLCEPDEKPPFLANTVVASHLQVLHYRDAKAAYIDKVPPVSFIVKDKVFEFSARPGIKVSLQWLAEVSLMKGLAKDIERCPVNAVFHDLKYRVEFAAARVPLLLHHEAQTYTVSEVLFVDRIEEVHQGMTSTPLAYEQRNIDGALAFVLFSKGLYHGNKFYTQQPFLKLPNGRFQPGRSAMSKIEGMHTISEFVEMLVPVEPEQIK
jgi:hypothetical protein